jgi:AraC-like DNA-binding protein
MTQQLQPIVVSSDAFPARERFDAWRETFALRFARVDATTPDRERFCGVITTCRLDRLCVVENTLSAVTLTRRREQLRDGNDDLALVLCTGRPWAVRSGDVAVVVHAGQAALVHQNLPCTATGEGAVATIGVRIGRAQLRELIGASDPPVLPLFPQDHPGLRLLGIYLRAFLSERRPLPAADAATAERHICELIASVFDPAADIVREGRFGGVKAARMQALAVELERQLADPGLTAGRIGAGLGLSERSVQQLLCEAGTTFSELLRRKRLQRARRLLEDSAPQRRTIADIAYGVGFGDLSHFNRVFRQEFGCTPSDLRRRVGG